MRILRLAFLAAVLPALGCQTLASRDIESRWMPSAGLTELAASLSGHFTSAGQAERDDRFLHIELRGERIWHDRTDGIWLYIEQAAGWALDRPYRQRVYHLTEVAPDAWVSAIHLLPAEDPLEFAGAWADPSRFDGLSPDDAPLREGCAIRLSRDAEGTFTGRTDGNGCGSSLGGAAYATSAVLITDAMLLSWDRGWSADVEQVWGAEVGPYLFERQSEGTD